MPLTTDRLILRHWLPSDLDPFATLNACDRVCQFLPKTLTRNESDALAEHVIYHFAQHGFGLYAVELKETGDFIGFTGLNTPSFEAHFMPAIEIGWRLASHYWGKGYATEAAKAVCREAFDTHELQEIVAFTAVNNLASQRVMQKIGMTYDPKEDFYHPKLSKDHPLAPHVLYRITSHIAP